MKKFSAKLLKKKKKTHIFWSDFFTWVILKFHKFFNIFSSKIPFCHLVYNLITFSPFGQTFEFLYNKAFFFTCEEK